MFYRTCFPLIPSDNKLMHLRLFFIPIGVAALGLVTVLSLSRFRDQIPTLVPQWVSSLPVESHLGFLTGHPFASKPDNALRSAPKEARIAEDVPLSELRVSAIRNGRNYGWVQLPKGTQVTVIKQEGDQALVQWDETVMNIHSRFLESGMVRGKGEFRSEN